MVYICHMYNPFLPGYLCYCDRIVQAGVTSMSNHRVSWEQEVPEVRKLLKSRNLTIVYCKRGKGTAGGWIEVCVVYPDNLPPMTKPVERYPGQIDQVYTNAYSDFRCELMGAVQYACGREDLEDDIQTDLFMVNILLSVISKEEYEKNKAWKKQQKDELTKGKTCKDCGTLGKYQQRKVRYRNVYLCPNCGKEWLY